MQLTNPSGPVAADDIEKVRRVADPTVRDMIDLQMLCGVHPAELCAMKLLDIDRASDLWRYVTASGRVIYFGHNARRILRPHLASARADRPIFPALAEYRQSVRWACCAAGVIPFDPQRLRLTAALHLAQQYGAEMAEVMLGRPTASEGGDAPVVRGRTTSDRFN